MRLLLLGANGQVGWELRRSLAPLGELIALGREGAPGLCGDLTDLDGLAATVRQLAPQVIVNAAAYTAVDRAEAEPDAARRINAEAPAVLAREAAASGAWLIHYSTDYVFDGSGGARAWREDDVAAPLGVYGATKLEGERAVAGSGAAHLILRTSWVYAARGANFVKTVLRLARERERLTIVDDQWGAPTGAELVADATAHALHQLRRQPGDGGIYHLAASGHTNWFEYSNHVLAHARKQYDAIKTKAVEILPIPTAAYPTPARRPLNARLDCTKLQRTFGLVLPPWQQGVDRMLDEIAATPAP